MNLAMDLTRVGEFLYSGNVKMSKQFLKRDQVLYKDMEERIGKLPMGKFLSKLEKLSNQMQGAELAFTGAEILLARS